MPSSQEQTGGSKHAPIMLWMKGGDVDEVEARWKVAYVQMNNKAMQGEYV